MNRLVSFLFALSLTGCGPTVATLLSHRQYREAICAGYLDERVSRALFEDTNAFVHLYALTDEEVASVLPDATKAVEVTTRARFVRLTVETNRIPVDGMRVAVTTSPAILTWPSLQTFAELTGETLPPSEVHTTQPNFALNFAAVVLSGGFWLLTDPFTPRAYTVAPPDETYRRAAPNAFALHRATNSDAACERRKAESSTGAPVGLRCTTYFLLARPVERPLTLNFTFEYTASRRSDTTEADPGREPSEADPCFAKHTVHVPIGIEALLPEWTRATFGTRPRRLTELARR